MFRVLDVRADGGGASEVDLGDERVAPPPDGTIRWIDITAHTAEQMKLLEQRFKFHFLAIEDCLHFDQRPKLEEYGDHLFLVVHGFACAANDPTKLEPKELHAFLGERYLVTVHSTEIAALTQVWRRVAGDPALARRGADFLYYLVVDTMVDANFDVLDLVSDEIEEIESAVIERPRTTDLARMFALKRTVVQMRKVLSPQRDVLAILVKRGDPRIGEKTSVYFRDVFDHLVRIGESIDTARDLLGNALEAHLSMVANRTNDIVKRLTIMSAVFLPLTFITGFFGQNFTHMPWKSWAALFVMIGLCVSIPTALLYWFYRSKWF